MRTIAVLLAAFPLLAAAQGAPPPQTWTTEPPPSAAPAPTDVAQPAQAPAAAPQPAYPSAPGRAARAARAAPAVRAPPRPQKTRDRWYIGFGLGGGNGKVANEVETADFTDLHYGGPTNFFMNFKAGATLNPKLLLGGDISVIGSAADKDGISTALSIANIDAVVTYFPAVKGFFLRGGLGVSAISYSVDQTGFGNQDGAPTLQRDGGARVRVVARPALQPDREPRLLAPVVRLEHRPEHRRLAVLVALARVRLVLGRISPSTRAAGSSARRPRFRICAAPM